MRFVHFRYRGKFGHFLRAEANVDGLTYPVPSATVLLGVAGAVLGLEKDDPQRVLAGARFNVAGEPPRRFWHKTNIRKDPPSPLPRLVRRTERGKTTGEQRNMRFAQEYLWRPCYDVWAALPEPAQEQLAARLREQRWHFTPCLGLSELLAHLDFVEEGEAESLPSGVHQVQSVAPRDSGDVDLGAAAAQGVALQALRMPASVTAERVFGHRGYWLEVRGRSFPLRTDQAFRCGSAVVVWL